SVIGRNIQPGVVFITFAERIAPATETVSDVSAHGPAARGRGECDLVPVKNIFDPTQLALQGGGRLLTISYLCIPVRASSADVLADIFGSADSRDFSQFALCRIKRGQPVRQLVVLALRFLIFFFQLAVFVFQDVEFGDDIRVLCETVCSVYNS